MNQVSKLKVCNRLLGVTLLLILVSGIQLETTSGRYGWSVWLHILLGVVLTILSIYHIYLHYRRGNWFARFARNRNTATRVLWWVFLLTAVSGIAATVVWLVGHDHSPLGAIHGKIGFLMVIVAIIHVARHRRQHRKAMNRVS